jgi:glyoxylase-like metal-dependent hydrolase (beta-lactamase superfamily II)
MIRAIVMGHRIPAGALGPEPVQLDVRAYLVAHASGVILVDTGMDAGGLALDAALGEAGAAWPDVSHVLITHAHRDHVGALDHVRQAAPAAAVMASPVEGLPGLSPLADRDVIGPLRVFASPGHTPGHLSFADEERGVLLVGDCVGVVGGRLVRAPERFTADL